jgi:pantetheine-phosphate adenylyltransferase
MKIGVYPGSFDPLTKGHINIVNKALKLFDEVHILISTNPNKKYLLDSNERFGLVEDFFTKVVGHPRVKVKYGKGLTIDYCVNIGEDGDVVCIVRGLRSITDFDFEFSMYQTNKSIVYFSGIETVFLMADTDYMFYSSSMVKEVLKASGNDFKRIEHFVPKIVIEHLKENERTAGNL